MLRDWLYAQLQTALRARAAAFDEHGRDSQQYRDADNVWQIARAKWKRSCQDPFYDGQDPIEANP